MMKKTFGSVGLLKRCVKPTKPTISQTTFTNKQLFTSIFKDPNYILVGLRTGLKTRYKCRCINVKTLF